MMENYSVCVVRAVEIQGPRPETDTSTIAMYYGFAEAQGDQGA